MMAKPLVKSCFGSPRIGKRGSAYHVSRAAIRDAKYDLAAAFIRERHAVVHQFLEMEAGGGGLELQLPAFWRREPFSDLLRCSHSWNSLKLAARAAQFIGGGWSKTCCVPQTKAEKWPPPRPPP